MWALTNAALMVMMMMMMLTTDDDGGDGSVNDDDDGELMMMTVTLMMMAKDAPRCHTCMQRGELMVCCGRLWLWPMSSGRIARQPRGQVRGQARGVIT